MFFKSKNGKDKDKDKEVNLNAADQNVTDILEYKYKKSKKKSNKRRIIISGVIVLIALVIVIFRSSLTVYNAKNLINNIGGTIRGENLREFPFVYDASGKYDFYREHLVAASSDGVKLYRPGQQGSTFIPLNYNDPRVIANDIFVIVYGTNQNSYSVIEGDDLILTQKLNGNIIGAKLMDAGNYIIITEDSGYKGVVNAFNNKREPIYKWYSAKNWVVSADLAPDCKKMAAIYIDTQQSSFKGGISFFELDKQDATAQYVFDNQMPLDVSYKDARLITVLTTGGISHFNSSGKLLNEYSFNSLVPYLATLQPNNYSCVLLGQDSKSDTGTLYIIDNEGKVKTTYQPKSMVKKLAATNHYIVLYTENSITVLDFDAKEKKVIPLDSSIKDVVLTVSGGVYTIAPGKAEHINY